MRAIGKYYLDTLPFNLGFSLLTGAYAGFLWGIIVFGTFGTLIGLLSFNYFKKHEYYFYHNLGYTRMALLLRLAIANVAVMLIGLGILGLYTLLG